MSAVPPDVQGEFKLIWPTCTVCGLSSGEQDVREAPKQSS